MPGSDVAVLGGTGHQGRGLAQRLALAGYSVVIGSRDPARAEAAAASWPGGARPRRCTDNSSAASEADIVVLTLPFDSLGATLDACHGSFRRGALVVDVTVPLTVVAGAMSLVDVPEGSATALVRARLPGHARVAGAFKTLPAALLGDVTRPLDCDEFVCGDSREARAEAATLVEALPALRAIDVGGISRAKSIEHLTLVAIAVNRQRNVHESRYRIVGA